MKRFIVLLIVCLFVFSGCGSPGVTQAEHDAPKEKYDELNEQLEEEQENTQDAKNPGESTSGESMDETHGGSVAEGENPVTNTENIEDQIDVELVKLPKDSSEAVCALIHNNSDVTIGDLHIQILFYDADGNITGEASDGHDVVLPGSTVVSSVSTYMAPVGFDHMDYKLTLDVERNSEYENHAADVKVETNLGDRCVIVQITNNAGVKIDEVEYIVVFYKNDKIVDVSNATDVRDIPNGETVIKQCNYYRLVFDRYEVYLNQAHTFGL